LHRLSHFPLGWRYFGHRLIRCNEIGQLRPVIPSVKLGTCAARFSSHATSQPVPYVLTQHPIYTPKRASLDLLPSSLLNICTTIIAPVAFPRRERTNLCNGGALLLWQRLFQYELIDKETGFGMRLAQRLLCTTTAMSIPRLRSALDHGPGWPYNANQILPLLHY
jgi:hypothetical protein